MNGINIKNIVGDRREDRHRGESNVKTEAEFGVLWPEANKCQHPPEAERGKEGFSPRVSRGSAALLTP